MKRNGKVKKVNKTTNSRNYNNLLGRVADIFLEARGKAVREIDKTQAFPIRQTLSDESLEVQKSETPSRKSAIPQTPSAKSKKSNVGLGRSGFAAARLLKDVGARVTRNCVGEGEC